MRKLVLGFILLCVLIATTTGVSLAATPESAAAWAEELELELELELPEQEDWPLEGSAEEAALLDQVVRYARIQGHRVHELRLDDQSDEHSFSRIVRVVLRREGPDDPRSSASERLDRERSHPQFTTSNSAKALVVVVPAGRATRQDASQRGAWLIARALLEQASISRPIELVFLGGDTPARPPFVGTKAYVDASSESIGASYVYLNLPSLDSSLTISDLSRHLNTSAFGPFVRSMYAENIRMSYSPLRVLFRQHALLPEASPIKHFAAFDAPVFLIEPDNLRKSIEQFAAKIDAQIDAQISDKGEGAQRAADNACVTASTATATAATAATAENAYARACARALLSFSQADSIDRDGSRLFVFFHLGSYPVLVDESYLLAISLCLAILLILISFLRYRYMKAYLNWVLATFWSLSVIIIISLVAIYAGSFLGDLLLYFRGLPKLTSPFVISLIGLRLVFFSAGIGILPLFLSRARVERRKGMFVALGSAWYLVLFLVATFIDIRLVAYFLLPLICSALIVILRPWRQKLLVYLVLTAFFNCLAFILIPASSDQVILAILNGKWSNLLIFSIAMPWGFMGLRILVVLKRRQRIMWGIIHALLCAALVWVLLFAPSYSSGKSQQVAVLQKNDTVYYASNDIIRIDGKEGRLLELKAEDARELLSYEYSYQISRLRRIHTLRILSKEPLVALKLFIESPNRIPTLYSVSVPVRMDTTSNTLNFVIGRNPPMDYSVEFSLPQDFEGKLNIIGVYERDAEADAKLLDAYDSLYITGQREAHLSLEL